MSNQMSEETPQVRSNETKTGTGRAWYHDPTDGDEAKVWIDGDVIKVACSGYRLMDKTLDGSFDIKEGTDYRWRYTSSSAHKGEVFDW